MILQRILSGTRIGMMPVLANLFAAVGSEVGRDATRFLRAERSVGTSPRYMVDRWLAYAAFVLVLALLVIVVVGEFTPIDQRLADIYFDPQRQVFPWDTTWFARNFMHGYVKNVIVWAGFILLAVAIVDLIRPFRRVDMVARARLRVLALSSLLEPTLIRTLKSASSLHCPWDIDRYGGTFQFIHLFDAVPPGYTPGHCFPAGHASTGMWFAALAVLWLPHAPRRATAAFFGGLGVGCILGWVQQMRGQHFMTHTLWTAWLAAVMVVALIAVFRRPLGTARPLAVT